MEKTDDGRKEDSKSEKVIYKVVHVPYYYPVPVDAEWYYKHYDRFSHQNGQFSHPDLPPHFDHFMPPPPGFPMPRRREHRSYREYRDDRFLYEQPAYYHYDQDRNSVSPSWKTSSSPTRLHSGKQSPELNLKESPKSDENDTNDANDTNDTNNSKTDSDDKSDRELQEKTQNEERKSKKTESNEHTEVKAEKPESAGEDEVTNDGEASDANSDKTNDTSSDKSVAVNRNRKRYMMKFPYDQLKKNKLNETDDTGRKSSYDDEESEENDIQRKYRKHVMLPADHQNMMSSHVPYVMVPMRSSKYMSPEEHYEARYHNSTKSTYEPRDYVKAEERSSREKTDQSIHSEDEDKREVRFHPNGRRARTVFTRQQLLTLNNVFEKHPFVSGERMSELSDQLGLDRKIVKIWFQNKRQYARKKGSLLEREEDYFYDYPGERYLSAPPPTMAERWTK